MDYKEILETYRKMGLGTQEERNQFLQWCPDSNLQNNNLVFIIESTNSDAIMEEKCPVGTKS